MKTGSKLEGFGKILALVLSVFFVLYLGLYLPNSIYGSYSVNLERHQYLEEGGVNWRIGAFSYWQPRRGYLLTGDGDATGNFFFSLNLA